MSKKNKIIVAMSGGVDSSVAAWLLLQQGYQVEGLFMKNWEEDDHEKYCNATIDLSDAQSVCNTLGITLHTVNFSAEYWDNVFTHFLIEYKLGRTPNPDILCNKEIKFQCFLKFSINNLKANFISTGHYVRYVNINGYNILCRGFDSNKDQSYFLYTLNNVQLSYCKFPIGTLTKGEVRKIATKIGLTNALKKDSTGICFIGKRKFKNFIKYYLSSDPGNIVSIYGNIVGSHQGLIYYTIGQRKGLSIGGSNNNQPWYVVAKDMKKNHLIVAQGRNNIHLMSIHFMINRLCWNEKKILTSILCCTVKTRYRQPDIECIIFPKSSGYYQVICSKPIIAITPGQSAVFYQQEQCLGGGIIEQNYPLLLSY